MAAGLRWQWSFSMSIYIRSLYEYQLYSDSDICFVELIRHVYKLCVTYVLPFIVITLNRINWIKIEIN